MKNEYKFDVGELVFAKFRGKTSLGRVEMIQRKGLNVLYWVSFKTAKRFQKRTEEEMEKTVKL